MLAEQILQTQSLFELLELLNEFCRVSYIRKNDEECLQLKNKLEEVTDNSLLMMLSSYLSICEDGDEVIEALYEFIGNCQGFAESGEETGAEVTKADVEAILDECEEKCALRSCIEKAHILNIVEVNGFNRYRELALQIKGNCINLIFPKIEMNIDRRLYIAEELGSMLYEIVKTKLSPEQITHELHRYIPETRNLDTSVKLLFRQYFYYVIQYRRRKPEIFTKFNRYMKQAIVMEFFRCIIGQYLLE